MIYTITAIHKINNENAPLLVSKRTFGYYLDIDKAIKAVLYNTRDINEGGYYQYVVIEIVPEGIHPISHSDKLWFTWNEKLMRYEEMAHMPRDISDYLESNSLTNMFAEIG